VSAPATRARQEGPRQPAVQRQPTLLSSCARAATAAEARYRITYPGFTHRSSRVIALGQEAEGTVRDFEGRPWDGGHFLVFESALPDDALLRYAGTGGTALLSEELDGADTIVMVASAGASAEAASVIGDAAAARGIMSAGLVLPGGGPVSEVVSALRPNAMVLVVLRDAADVLHVLSALRV
jgi:hypothetical protein